MSHESIKPLFDDTSAPSELRDFVTLARNDGASQADLDRLTRRMAPVLGVSAAFIATSAAAVGTTAPLTAASSFGAPASGLTPALTAASAAKVGAGVGAGAGAVSAAKVGLFGQLMASASAKVLAVSLSLGAAGVAVYSATSSEGSGSERQVLSASGRAALSGESAAVPHKAGTGSALTDSPLPAAEATPLQAPSVAQLVPAQNAELPPNAVPSAALVRSKAAPRVAVPAPTQAEAKQPLPPEPAITDQPVTSAAADAKPSLPPPSELSLIERAEAARARPSEALAFLAKHEEVYPRGALAQEREVLAIELLLKAGKFSQAEGRSERFEDAYPRSAHLPHLRALLTRANAK